MPSFLPWWGGSESPAKTRQPVKYCLTPTKYSFSIIGVLFMIMNLSFYVCVFMFLYLYSCGDPGNLGNWELQTMKIEGQSGQASGNAGCL
jgi:hypothetical protein